MGMMTIIVLCLEWRMAKILFSVRRCVRRIRTMSPANSECGRHGKPLIMNVIYMLFHMVFGWFMDVAVDWRRDNMSLTGVILIFQLRRKINVCLISSFFPFSFYLSLLLQNMNMRSGRTGKEKALNVIIRVFENENGVLSISFPCSNHRCAWVEYNGNRNITWCRG